MRAVDTNVLVRLVVQDDAAQQASALAFVSSGAWVSHLVLAETVWVLESVYQLGNDDQADAIEMLLNHEYLSIEDPQAAVAAVGRFRKRPSLGFTDCLILEIARKAGHTPLGTFDKNLAKIDGAFQL